MTMRLNLNLDLSDQQIIRLSEFFLDTSKACFIAYVTIPVFASVFDYYLALRFVFSCLTCLFFSIFLLKYIEQRI